MSPAKPVKPLDFKCPCGYTKKLPVKYDGRKIVCPKCRTVLRIEKIRLEAELILRCPYCKNLHDYEEGLADCASCKKEFFIPKPALPKKPPARGNQNAPSPVVVTAGRKPSLTRKSKRRNPLLRRLSSLVTIFLPTMLIVAIWHFYGDDLGMPTLPWKEAVAAIPKKSGPVRFASPSTAKVVAKNELPVQQPQEKKIPSNNSSVSQIAKKLINENIVPDSPKLLSPSLELVGANVTVEQALDSNTSNVLDWKRFLNIEIENLTRCTIDSVKFRIYLRDGQGKDFKTHLGAKTFSVPVGPEERREFDVELRTKKEIERVVVEIVKTKSGEQSDSTPIRHEFDLRK